MWVRKLLEFYVVPYLPRYDLDYKDDFEHPCLLTGDWDFIFVNITSLERRDEVEAAITLHVSALPLYACHIVF